MNFWLAIGLGVALGFAIAWVLLGRRRINQAAFEEIDRSARFSMRQVLGYRAFKVDPIIANLSPQFAAVVNEAALAEHYGLGQVAGVGYGKALELLIKDYAKREHPANASAIEAAPLASAIRDYISDEALRASTDLARWLRNDEMHYLRRFATRDLRDLKRLLDLATALIVNAEHRRTLETEAQRELQSFTGPDRRGDGAPNTGPQPDGTAGAAPRG